MADFRSFSQVYTDEELYIDRAIPMKGVPRPSSFPGEGSTSMSPVWNLEGPGNEKFICLSARNGNVFKRYFGGFSGLSQFTSGFSLAQVATLAAGITLGGIASFFAMRELRKRFGG